MGVVAFVEVVVCLIHFVSSDSISWPFAAEASSIADFNSHRSIIVSHIEVVGIHLVSTFHGCLQGITRSTARRNDYSSLASSGFSESVVESKPDSSSFHAAICSRQACSVASDCSHYSRDLLLHLQQPVDSQHLFFLLPYRLA